MIKEDVLNEIRTAFKVDGATEILETFKSDDIEGWDSLAQLNLIMALENRFNVRFDFNDISNITDIQSIMNIVEKNAK